MFPYGTGETFIENEFPFIEQEYEQIIIITNHPIEQKSRLSNNQTIKVIYFPYELSNWQKLLSLKHIFHSDFIKELNTIKSSYKLSFNSTILKTCFSSFQKAIQLEKLINDIIKKFELKPSELVLYSYWMNDLALGIAYYTKKNKQTFSICRAHGWDVYMNRHLDNYLPFRNFILTYIDKCFAISENGLHYLNQLTKDAFQSKIELAHLGTINHERSHVEKDSVFRLVSCSNLIPLKRVNLIIEALTEVNFHLQWVHFGSGKEFDALQQKATHLLQKKDNLEIIFKGQVDNAELKKYYSTTYVDSFINVSETEGIPVSIMEALSFGIPCIATNVGGNAEIVNPENGIVLAENPSILPPCSTR
jgi:glycosyltransferase involved in cell wall biosynthesis